MEHVHFLWQCRNSDLTFVKYLHKLNWDAFRFLSFDLMKSPIYEIVHLNFCVTVHMTIIGNTGMNCIIWALGNHLIVQLRILQHRLRTLNMKDAEIPDIVELIDMQGKIFEYLQELNDILKPTLFFQLILGAIMICVLGYQIVIV